MAEIIKCPVCAFEISDNSKICMLCGTKINSDKHYLEQSEQNSELNSESANKHFTITGIMLIALMAIMGILSGGFIGFYGGIAISWLLVTILNCRISFIYKEAPIITFISFFVTMIVFGCYVGGSLAKLILLSNRFNDNCHPLNYSKYFRRLFRAWIYAFIGMIINVHLFIIMETISRGSIEGCNNLIILTPILIVAMTIVAIILAKKH